MNVPFVEERAGGELRGHLDAGQEADVAGVAVWVACAIFGVIAGEATSHKPKEEHPRFDSPNTTDLPTSGGSCAILCPLGSGCLGTRGRCMVATTPADVPIHRMSLHASSAVMRRHAALCWRIMSSHPANSQSVLQHGGNPDIPRSTDYGLPERTLLTTPDTFTSAMHSRLTTWKARTFDELSLTILSILFIFNFKHFAQPQIQNCFLGG